MSADKAEAPLTHLTMAAPSSASISSCVTPAAYERRQVRTMVPAWCVCAGRARRVQRESALARRGARARTGLRGMRTWDAKEAPANSQSRTATDSGSFARSCARARGGRASERM